MKGGANDGSSMVTVPASASFNFVTAEDSMSDDVFEMDDDSTVTNALSGGLTPAVGERPLDKTPSPTGYRDYKPPAEVLSNNYSTTFQTTSDFDSVRSTLKRDHQKEDNFAHKTILLGDSGVGKTSLLVQFDTGRFQPGNFAATVGIGFTNKVVTVDDTPIKLQIWDTAGQERFRSVTHAYYRDAHALLLLYDVTNKTSYDNIRAWLSEIREHANEDVVIMLLGNKSDCGTERIVKREDGERLAHEYKVPFMETSAKTGLNVELAFLAVARELKARKSDNPDETKFNVQDYVRQQSQRSSCFNSICLTT
ncbi:ras-related protein Rab-37-like isoform X1 [Linepithema humile]|uniref:ras-related protein Rab-37-like isoform X1 n=1 Tax=Linepithema humile TaxID=83485 RepID=UPI0006238C96|nr:PREDICTED: ras-related protein Rab-37-like isoform X1 [Linepithema humile]XP_012234395.1 PREDICTED: ras-related protein Rab-37-like isoform X1 [Linepithema humile]XP_012234396.1 PREDICTED: ras-related protein Rab-37-like isoform X1 [Linepithema humile]XP_012234397.1 PREDICTED: ras-related protein Rab-37-like isoform X1 [Linepithema humile]